MLSRKTFITHSKRVLALGLFSYITVSQAGNDIQTLRGEVIADLNEPLVTAPSTSPKGASVVDQQDYYILNTGETASFLRRENTYLVVNDTKITAPAVLSNLIQSQLGSQIVAEHSLGKFVVVELTREESTQTLFELAQIDPSVSFVSQVLINPETGAQLGVVPEIIVRIAKTADLNEVVMDLQVHNLSLISKLAFTDREYQFAIDEDITDIGRIFEITRAVAALPSIEWAEPNFIATAEKTVFTPNDPLFGDQWHLHNTGQGGGLSDADVDAPEGWDISKGTGAVIAVYDDGVETTHEDLTIWSNPGETGGGKESNGVDDDGNGYIDDYQGWDFVGNDNDPNPATANDNHGTAVAGVAGATGNNSVGVTGSAVEAVILPIRSGSMTCADFGNAMRYAGKYADVVNNSWGISACESELNSAISDVVNGNIAGARRGTKGAPVLFATGNSASGWKRFSYDVTSAGTHQFAWFYVKNDSNSQGYDTMWLDHITWPGGETTDENFSAFGTGGAAPWSIVSDGIHAWNASGSSLKAGSIGDSQYNYVVINKNVTVGTLYFWVWVSSEMGMDGMLFQVDGTNQFFYAPGQYGGHQNEVSYPASNPDTIAVGASHDGLGNLEQRSAYSQFGPEVDVVAPSGGGVSGITTTDRTGSVGYASGNYTNGFSGTSSATPLVAGIVANIIAYTPTLTAVEIREALHLGTDQIGPYAYSSSRNDYYGYGRVNMEKALQAAENLLVTLAYFTVTPSDWGMLLQWQTDTEIDNAGFHLWRSEEEEGEYIRITNSMIPAQGSGSQYSYLDEDAIDDITYYYKLEDIDLYGVSTFHGPISSTAYILITPAEGAVLPIRTPATFEWVDSEDIEGYKLQFSNQSDFSGKVVTRPKNQRKWITSNVYTPTEQKWRAIKRLGKKGLTIFWRVLGKIEDETVIYSETGSLTLEKTQF
jgi:subtilisin family serine protease